MEDSNEKFTMDELDLKALDAFPGMVVRKDLTAKMKKGHNVPTYVLEYLLGMYCATDDPEDIREGMRKVDRVLTENYVNPDQSDVIKSRIRETGQYHIIDKLKVSFDEREDAYVASFSNLKMDPFTVNPDFVVHNEKLLTGGVWCIVTLKYCGSAFGDPLSENEVETEVFGTGSGAQQKQKSKRKASRQRYDSVFAIEELKPIQMSYFNLDEILQLREEFTDEEWIDLLLRSAGYEPGVLEEKQKLHYLLRFVPFIQKNYSMVELGPRGTGKSHVYSELSPYSILMSSGHTTVSNMFYNMSTRRVGLVGNWDCIAFDEVGGMKGGSRDSSQDMVQILKNYMANGSFARGVDSVHAEASIAFEGNTFRSIPDMLRTSHLFEPFPDEYSNDSAFFDRICAYLPGWETPKLRSEHYTAHFGLNIECFAEFCHRMRKYDFSNDFSEYFELNRNFNTRDETAVRLTFSGLAKLICPHRVIGKEITRRLLEYAIECRRRVKEQLRKMSPSEFSDVDLGYIDLETGETTIVTLPEIAAGTLIPDSFEPEGYVYAIGRSVSGKIGVYRLENKIIRGNGGLHFQNVEGISGSKAVRDSIMAAFNYFREEVRGLTSQNPSRYEYSLYYNDLQRSGPCMEISVAEVVGLCSALVNRPVTPATVICGRVVMSGSMMPLTVNLDEIVVAAVNAGADVIMLPEECLDQFNSLPADLRSEIRLITYSTPLEAAQIALGAKYI